MDKKDYYVQLERLQIELSKLQDWVTDTGYRAVVLFEGRDTAGKGGTIRALTEKLSPRVFRTVALPKPSDRQQTQWYFQRYVEHLPAAGEVVLFDRSWYNRAGVEVVMGFCTEQQRDDFLAVCPGFEQELVRDGINLVKYWLEVSSSEQKKRLQERIDERVKNWKFSGMDIEARRRWYDYSRARDIMMGATDTELNPWHIVNADDQRAARLNCLSHLLSVIPYHDTGTDPIELPSRGKDNQYDDQATMQNRRYVLEHFK